MLTGISNPQVGINIQEIFPLKQLQLAKCMKWCVFSNAKSKIAKHTAVKVTVSSSHDWWLIVKESDGGIPGMVRHITLSFALKRSNAMGSYCDTWWCCRREREVYSEGSFSDETHVKRALHIFI